VDELSLAASRPTIGTVRADRCPMHRACNCISQTPSLKECGATGYTVCMGIGKDKEIRRELTGPNHKASPGG
jgi:hypothetical protein